MTPERVALGLIAQEVWARDPDQVGKKKMRKTRPIEEKETHKWLKSLEAVIELSQEHSEVHFVSLGDREADVYDLFLVERPETVDVLTRAAWDRRVEHPEKYLWASVQAQPVAAEVRVEVPRQGNHPAREARLEVR
jgi:broad specificity phosphatase PhoE